MSQFAPALPLIVQEQRKWLVRVVRFLAGPAGIDQFLDLGSGLPTAQNTHEIAQQVNPDATVVYVDNDPVVVAHGRARAGGERAHPFRRR
ncbi:SAM-dependent methyltransferase [Fodinicola feengrottensis]|uniref:SAM-dependent methyltransferase n=1 Tax=Fodinicola feengrottensis TaxID=435914 RepID=UPI0028BEFF3C|nr:SAM-dependent methyltransferase [Fodinicola feengrottensis]